MSEPLHFFTPCEGRFINGDMDKLRTRDHQNKPLDFAKQSFDFGIAFPKAQIWQLLAESFYPYLSSVYASDPQGLQRLNAWFQQPGLGGKRGGLSMKIGDGDVANAEGKKNEHAAGCYVFYMTSFGMGDKAEPPKIVAGPNQSSLVEIDLSMIKRGDYVAVAGSIVPNGLQGDNQGIYLNCNTVWKTRDGDRIAGGVDPTQAFGGANIQGTFDPSGGATQQFGGAAPAFNPTQPPAGNAPAPQPMGHAGMPGQVGMPGVAQGSTASPGEPQTTPHTAILSGPPPMPGQ